jgi:uncharacterized protein (DUF2164 family)
MSRKNPIKISKEIRTEMIASIKNYFEKERDEELGDLAAGLVLDFITEELAPEFYNQGVYDSHKFMNLRCEDLLTILK